MLSVACFNNCFKSGIIWLQVSTPGIDNVTDMCWLDTDRSHSAAPLSTPGVSLSTIALPSLGVTMDEQIRLSSKELGPHPGSRFKIFQKHTDTTNKRSRQTRMVHSPLFSIVEDLGHRNAAVFLGNHVRLAFTLDVLDVSHHADTSWPALRAPWLP